jgi:acetate kinase
MPPSGSHVLAINTGSTSLKAALFAAEEARQLTAAATALGSPQASLRVASASGEELFAWRQPGAGHADCLGRLLAWLDQSGWLAGLAAAGHRVVHGGVKYTAPCPIDGQVLAELRRLTHVDPDHLPQAIAAIEAVEARCPNVPQIACFDTGFHRTLPEVARTLPLPLQFRDRGLVRLGFHGLSFESLTEQLRVLDPQGAGGRAVLAHLGGGSSLAAVVGGRSIDTTMGFTPTGGLVMGTRSGDLDPGTLLYLMAVEGLTPQRLNHLVNYEAGLLGLSGTSGDMRELLAQRGADRRAALAVDLFCYQVRKGIGAYAAALGGLDTLVFAGGIGEHAAAVRLEICRGLEFLGLALDEARNAASEGVISADGSRAVVRVLTTDEERMICRHALRLLE